ncbi:MAG: membrane protease YdiL (CAAX protease family) [Candidatus Krumholzibacteriia bacterium]|jgi:membrane protease YdiL (CAAX protease family)
MRWNTPVHESSVANSRSATDHWPMDNFQTSPPPSLSLWDRWPAPRILGLAILLMATNFILQMVFYTLIGGLFVPVLMGTIGGVILPLGWLAQRNHFPYRTDYSLTTPKPVTALLSGLVALAALVPTSLLAQWSMSLHPPDPEWASFMAENMPSGAVETGLAILTVVILAPLAEELIFRGFIHRLASRKWGPLAATVISALIFGLIHGEPWYLFGLVGIGIVLALVYETTGSVLACWITHMVHNAVSLGMMLANSQPTSEVAPVTITDGLIGAVSLMVLVVLLKTLHRLNKSY